MKNLQGGIKKSREEIENESLRGWSLVDQNLSRKFVPELASWLEEFQKTERPGGVLELESDVCQYHEGLGDVLNGGDTMGRRVPKFRSGAGGVGAERPKKKRRGKANPLGDELDLDGEFHGVIYLSPS